MEPEALMSFTPSRTTLADGGSTWLWPCNGGTILLVGVLQCNLSSAKGEQIASCISTRVPSPRVPPNVHSETHRAGILGRLRLLAAGVMSMKELGSNSGSSAVDDVEPLTRDRHGDARHLADTTALTTKV